MLCLLAVVPCLSCWLYPRHRVWDDEGPVPDAEAVEPLSHILPCWPSTMQVSALLPVAVPRQEPPMHLLSLDHSCPRALTSIVCFAGI